MSLMVPWYFLFSLSPVDKVRLRLSHKSRTGTQGNPSTLHANSLNTSRSLSRSEFERQRGLAHSSGAPQRESSKTPNPLLSQISGVRGRGLPYQGRQRSLFRYLSIYPASSLPSSHLCESSKSQPPTFPTPLHAHWQPPARIFITFPTRASFGLRSVVSHD
jgi:hypothetical protein